MQEKNAEEINVKIITSWWKCTSMVSFIQFEEQQILGSKLPPKIEWNRCGELMSKL